MKKRILFLSLFVLTILSFSAFAQGVPSPSEAFSGLGDFFTGLFTGATDSSNLYLLTVLFYYVIFMVLFMEGVRLLPLFGNRGEINASGKWFAWAAAGLATLGIFIAEQASGKSVQEIMVGVLSPFGVYGGFAIAGLLAWITFHTISHMETFKEKTVTAMAFAAAVGLSVAGYILSMNNLLGWSYIILLLVFIFGCIPNLVSAWSNRDKSSPSTVDKVKEFYTRGPRAKKEKRKETKKTKKDTKKVEKFALAELSLLKDIRGDIEKSKDICGTNKSEHGINLTREGRTLRRMRSRTNGLISDLKDFEKIASDAQKSKITKWKEQINIYFNSLVKVCSRGGELEKILKKQCTKSWNKTAKKKDLLKLVDDAIQKDTALIATFEEINKEFNKALVQQQIKKAENVEEE